MLDHWALSCRLNRIDVHENHKRKVDNFTQICMTALKSHLANVSETIFGKQDIFCDQGFSCISLLQVLSRS